MNYSSYLKYKYLDKVRVLRESQDIFSFIILIII